ncbi:TraR/DksA C4-type zinc finger protein [Acinetobacter boissieri]|uniref:Transcriptional regulator, TraR/DksA family n=1 Tax=Acinetobacter boissieri TaxID=1219383 RepID=A0A1G6KCR4_9GAMM|nr:TraR/DksA C4-type zinc finger protein [Acinetobacter boissieri]SDC28859.1 transcriptional regulator, TraR/DksA family [Acinetobacter boissieri]
MADLADMANDFQESILSQTLNQRVVFSDESEHECLACGDEIPKQRLKLGGVKYCIECQSEIERKAR